VEIIAEKTCTKCGQTKRLEEFRKTHGRDGQPCLICHREINKRWRDANPELNKAINNRYSDTHKRETQARNRKRYLEKKPHIRSVQKVYEAKNKDKRRAYKKAYDERNRDKHKDYNRARRNFIPGLAKKLLDNARRWAKEHPARIRELNRQADTRRRARQNGAAVNDFTAAQWRELKAKYKNLCAYCGICADRIEQDHVLPISRGGNHTLSNIVPACKRCNSRKKDRTPDEAGMKFVITPD